MDGTKPGEAGVIAWCNSIRFSMAKDPGRQFLHEQIQEGFDFLDMYLENFLNGPKHEPVIELLKTPGRKKNAPARTRAANSAATRTQAITSLSLEDGAAKENRQPINSFHKALLQVKKDDDESGAPRRQHSEARSHSQLPNPFGELKNPRIVTIADSPAVNLPETMDVDPVRKPLPAPIFQAPSQREEPVGLEESLQPKDSIKELSMIAEDEEPVEKARVSPRPFVSAQGHQGDILSAGSNGTVFHDAAMGASDDVAMEQDVLESIEDANQDDVVEPVRADTTTATFHTIPLSPHDSDTEPTSARSGEFHTAPLPKVSLPPVPVEEEPNSHTAPLPSSTQHEEYTMPLRDEPSAPVPGLSRKSSMSQFAALPAPSPLRKSLRTPGEPTPGVGAGPSSAPSGAKRSSTSWLSKARETKAMAKRTSTLGGEGTTLNANKRKSGEMLEVAKDAAKAVLAALDEEERIAKMPKLSNPPTDISSDYKGKGKARADSPVNGAMQQSSNPTSVFAGIPSQPIPGSHEEEEDDMLTTLMKKNQGSRTGKGMGKSLGGGAAAALAEARAQAEARVAERHKLELGIAAESTDVAMTEANSAEPIDVARTVEPEESKRRLSVSDLVPSSQSKGQNKEEAAPLSADTSVSTTPPNTPPRTRTISFNGPPAPVFSKPPPPGSSAAPPPSRDAKAQRDFKLPTTNPFSMPTAMAVGLGPKYAPLSAQSSKASIFSDIIFDRRDTASPSWMPSTQDTSFSAAQSQENQRKVSDGDDDLGDDDSWGVDEQFAGHQIWTPFGFTSSNPDQFKDDTMTWSTIPSQSTSQKGGDTEFSLPQPKEFMFEGEAEVEQGFAERLVAVAQHSENADDEADEADVAMEIDEDDAQEAEERDQNDASDAVFAAKPTIKLVQHTKLDASTASSQPRSDSQQSMASTSSSQSNLGFFGQASKLVSSVLGGGKKGKPEVKSLQLAAAAAKKQQEEQEKKAQRLKEMEARRQQAMQRKAEEEKARAAEEERKIKEEAERRKREREEHTDKRPLRNTTTAAKKGDDDTMKRKLAAPASQKPPSKEKGTTALPGPRQIKPSMSKPTLKSALKQPTAGSSVPVTPGTSKVPQKTVKHAPSSSNLKAVAPAGKGKERDVPEAQYPQPTRKAPGPPPRGQEPRVASETIELPDINSEYSDSEDEDRPKRDLPDWAKSPDIAAALQQQSTINPDDIFGPIGPLRMEEIFRTRHSRFRARTSSANWTGTDELTQAEEKEYARRMGFK